MQPQLEWCSRAINLGKIAGQRGSLLKKVERPKNEETETQGFKIDFLRVFSVAEPMGIGIK